MSQFEVHVEAIFTVEELLNAWDGRDVDQLTERLHSMPTAAILDAFHDRDAEQLTDLLAQAQRQWTTASCALILIANEAVKEIARSKGKDPAFMRRAFCGWVLAQCADAQDVPP